MVFGQIAAAQRTSAGMPLRISATNALTLTKDYHARPTDWRWQRATGLAQAGRRTSRIRDDHHILEAVSFLRVMQNRNTEAGQLALHDKYPHMMRAWCLGTQPDSTQYRYEVEARILARETPDQIARKVHVPAKAIEHFEAWFFNVSDRLDSPSYITHMVLGPQIHVNMTLKEYALLWKLYGYYGGTHVLDAIMNHAENPIRPDDPSRVGSFFADDQLSTVRRQAAITARTSSGQRADLIFETYVRCLEIERMAGASGAQESMVANIEKFMSCLPYHFGEQDSLPDMQAYDAKGISMRGKEIFDVCRGKPAPQLEHLAAEFQYPTAEESPANG